MREFLRSIPALRQAFRRAYPFYDYVAHRVKLAKTVVADRLDEQEPGSTPVPPARLRHRVHGTLDRASFFDAGRAIAGDLQSLLQSQGRTFSSFARVLDFGCGCGRVLGHLGAGTIPPTFHGTDIDGEAISWCQGSFPKVHWDTNQDLPPTRYNDETFDLIYSISVFTHLNEQFQFAWLAELQRLTKPGGLLILTIHGSHVQRLPHIERSFSPEERRILEEGGFLYKVGATGKLKLDGLPDYYQNAFHTRDYIDRVWSRYFTVVSYHDRAINRHQDAVILRKR
jgi:SAM-dependent methyltransferase